MFSDNTLTPKEAIRLCALGTLALAPLSYSELATSIRHFVSRIQGPSLDMMGSSIELLKYEGLVEAIDGVGMEDDATLALTETGRSELKTLLTANVRAAATELNKLVVALKFRFLHLLDPANREAQAALLIDVTEKELARLEDLRAHHGAEEAGADGFLADWLDHDIDLLSQRLAWLTQFKENCGNA